MDRRDFLRNCVFAALGCSGLPAMQAAEQVAVSVGRALTTGTANVSKRVGMFWKPAGGTDTICEICPRMCKIKVGERGFCGVRENQDGKYVTLVYGKPAVVRADPMEKGPFFHFLPGTRTIALGTAGCNLDCK
ncbi:MAG: radical SAM protein, partial [Armatimonadetes bacterium]|nr:radical SAM protein [Armatimonadota bacterium]